MYRPSVLPADAGHYFYSVLRADRPPDGDNSRRLGSSCPVTRHNSVAECGRPHADWYKAQKPPSQNGSDARSIPSSPVQSPHQYVWGMSSVKMTVKPARRPAVSDNGILYRPHSASTARDGFHRPAGDVPVMSRMTLSVPGNTGLLPVHSPAGPPHGNPAVPPAPVTARKTAAGQT